MLQYLDNEQLAINIEIYSFDDAQIILQDGKEIHLQGVIDLDFTKVDESFNHAFGTQKITSYEVNEVYVNITTIYDCESVKITLNDEELKECAYLIENHIRSQSIETNI